MGLIVGLTMVAARKPLVALFATGDNLSATTIATAYAVTIFCSLEYFFRNISYVQLWACSVRAAIRSRACS